MRRTFLLKTVFTVIIILLMHTISFSQNGIITGKVKYDKEALPSATVSFGNKTMLTDDKGEFYFTVKPGNYTLVITHAGYKKIEQDITVDSDSTKKIYFDMVPNEQLGEIVVLGSRSAIQRSNLYTPVPVDAFSSHTLIQTGETSLTQMLTYTAPSFNASRQLFNEPVTLRGLDPDHVLILVNGIRYHTMAWLYTGNLKGHLGRGSVGNDLNSIPFSAIEKIEILRDGASAQYGSDAIAGVMNIQLKKSTGKTSIHLHTGQFYKGDGEKFSTGINRGISLSKKGFLNFWGDYRFQAPTYRGGEYLGLVYYNFPKNATAGQSDSILALDNKKILERGFSRKTPVSNVGITKVNTFGFLINGGYRINNSIELYWTGMINDRILLYEGAYRFPKDTNQVNTALYPDGFKVRVHTTTYDVSGIAGAKGEIKKNWRWELSSAYGNNSVDNKASNTDNASQFITLGKNAPTAFYCGKQIFNQLTNNLNFAKNLVKAGGSLKSCNLGFGAEWRFEKFQQKAGEEASWKNYDSSGKRQGGAQGAPTINREDTINKRRNIAGIYIDLETEMNNHFLFDLAGRYEYYNEFGGNLAGKMAMRYKFSNTFSVRASVSNGFRAPSMQQRYLNTTSNVWTASGNTLIPARRGIFSNDHPLTKAFDIPSLQAERSINLSGGFTATIFNHISITADAYWIQIKNRIVLSGIFDKTNPAVKKILDDFPGVQIDQVQFFTNAINTRTNGADIILDGKWNIRKASLWISLAANFTANHLFGDIKTSDKLPSDSLNTNTLFNIEERTKIEKGQPNEKIIFSVTYKKGKTGLIIRNTRFGKTSTATIFTNPDRTLYEFFSPKILTDLSYSYSVKAWLILTVGANNIFNVYPDRLKNYANTVQGISIYSDEASPFGFNGGYYYLSMAFDF